jgi:hypothetical protein
MFIKVEMKRLSTISNRKRILITSISRIYHSVPSNDELTKKMLNPSYLRRVSNVVYSDLYEEVGFSEFVSFVRDRRGNI